MVTIKPKAQYHSMYFFARILAPVSMLSKFNNKFKAANTTTNTEKPIPKGVAALVKGAKLDPEKAK